MKHFRSVWALWALLWISCNTATEVPAPEMYFDHAGFIRSEVLRLNAKHVGVLKTIRIGDKETVFRNDTLDWTKELALLAAVDLLKPVYAGKFNIRRTQHDSIQVERYTPLSDRINIRAFELERDLQGNLKALSGRKEEQSLVTRSALLWRYVPDSGYVIEGSEQLRGLAESRFRVAGKFEPYF